MRGFWILVLIPLALVGCDAKEAFGFQIDLSQLNWQTGALIALAYLANSKGHFSALAKSLKAILQSLKILPGDTSKESLTADQIAAILADLFARLNGHPELQSQVLSMMQTTSLQAAAEATSNASK